MITMPNVQSVDRIEAASVKRKWNVVSELCSPSN